MKEISEIGQAAPSDSAAGYEAIYRDSQPKLNLKTSLSFKIGESWYYDIPRTRDHVTLTCPPFSDVNVPTFLHYLCHTKILEDGWQFPITKTIGISSDAPHYFFTFNRAIDHFFDYYAWRLVVEIFGPAPVMLFTSGVAAATPELIIENLAHYTKQFGAPYPSYIMALDWFSLFPLIAVPIDRQREKVLLSLSDKVARRKDFASATVPVMAKNLVAVREFFQSLLAVYPRYNHLFENRGVFRAQYKNYYALVQRDTGLNSEIVDYY